MGEVFRRFILTPGATEQLGFVGALKDQRPREGREKSETKVLRQVGAELPGTGAGQRRKSGLDLGRP